MNVPDTFKNRVLEEHELKDRRVFASVDNIKLEIHTHYNLNLINFYVYDGTVWHTIETLQHALHLFNELTGYNITLPE